MKNIVFKIIALLTISVISTSCATEIIEYNITVISNTNLSEGTDEPLPPIIKDLIEPTEDLNSSNVYVPKLVVLRSDLNEKNEMEIEVPISMENKFRKKMGTYSYVDLKLDYDEFLPKMTSGEFLSKKGNSTNNSTGFKINANDLIFILTSSNTNEPNHFTDVKSLKIKLDSILISEGKNFNKKVYIKYEQSLHKQEIIEVRTDIISNPETKSKNPCSNNTLSSALDLRDDMLKAINVNLSLAERNELAIAVWNKYFDKNAYIALYQHVNDNNPEIWNPGEGKNYFTHRLSILESITDINIFRIETSTKTDKISGIKLIECHNASEAI